MKPGVEPNVILKKNEGIKILTGAPIPSGATRIIFKENTKEQDQKIYFAQDDDEENNVRVKGEDFKKGDLLFEKGCQIRYSSCPSFSHIYKFVICKFLKRKFFDSK